MKPNHYEFIDSLRGIAALSVLVVHLGRLTNPKIEAPAWIFPLTDIGGTGVILFFVLSAFTLSLSMNSRRDEDHPIRNYFVRRFFRIAPLFYVVMIATYLRDIHVFGVWQPWSEIFKSTFFVLNFFPGSEQGFVWASWTIGAEMAFYVVFPLIFFLSRNLTSSLLILFITLFARWVWQLFIFKMMGETSEANTFYSISILHHLPHFVMGIVLYHAYNKLKYININKYFTTCFLLILPVVIFVLMAYKIIDSYVLNDRSTSCAVLFCIFTFGLSRSPIRIAVNKFTIFMGKISYSVYLIHANVIYFIGPHLLKFISPLQNSYTTYIFCLLSTLAITALISSITYLTIEKRGNSIGKWVISLSERRHLVQHGS